MKIGKMICIIICFSFFKHSEVEAAICSEPPLSNCSCSFYFLTCVYGNASTYLLNAPVTATTLSLFDTPFTDISPNLFPILPDLTYMSLNNIKMTQLPDGFMNSYPSLKYFQLNDNPLTELPPDLFSNMLNLEELVMERNEIALLPRPLFESTNNLFSVLLNDNNISELPAGLFSNNSKMRTILLNNNNISTVDLDVFSGIPQLATITLRLNGNPTMCCSMRSFVEFAQENNWIKLRLTCKDFNVETDFNNFNLSSCPPPVDGQWSEWTNYEFSVTCGAGVIRRSRQCNNPAPAYGGQDCIGRKSEEIPWSFGKCPEFCADNQGICLPKKMKCKARYLNKRCASCHHRCCEKSN